ncbi:MAG: carboxypeptidase regulatory-like domain-containing protein, partial [Chloroflexi bacterium]|nr:carboxypeptidase regulatory-like domain-containing protein [Chloroflexota bacterium]
MTRLCVSGLMLLLSFATIAHAQNTSQVFGRVTDASGGVLPGVTVTLSSPALLEARLAVTSETGSYEFSGLPIGIFVVRFELGGFGSQVREGLQLQSGFNSQLNVELELAALAESVTVTFTTPVVDTRSVAQSTRMNFEELQAIPSARDVFQVLVQTPGIAGDRQNVGGTINGQQTGMFSRGSANGQNRWFVDGVDRNDIANGRPFVVDFNSVDEVQVITGGADVTMQTPGVMVNVVTKSGGDSFSGAGWLFRTDKNLGSTNITDLQRQQGANFGSPLVFMNDYGGQLGGPIKQGRAWFFATYGMQNVRLGVLNYYKPTAGCAPVKANPLGVPFDNVVDCLNLSLQDVPQFGSKFNFRPFDGNLITFANSFGQRIESIRSASDLRPDFETTNQLTFIRQADTKVDVGAKYWNHGVPDPSWKFSTQQSFSDRWLAELSFGHHCWCATIVPQTEALRSTQQMTEQTTGVNGRSYESVFVQFITNDTLDVTSTYFLPGKWGGDHSFSGGYKSGRYGETYDLTYTGGGVAIFNSPRPQPAFTTAFTGRLRRDYVTPAVLHQQSMWLQDTYTKDRLTMILGLRWDRQEDEVRATTAVAHAFQGQPTLNGTPFNFFPALDVPNVKAGVVWNTVAPRLGVTYDLTGDAKNVVKASYGIYFDQRSAGQLSKALNPTGSAYIDLGWTDLNRDKTVQAGEVDTNLIRNFRGFNPANPGALVSSNIVDPNTSAPRTKEFILGYEKEMEGGVGFGISYIRRAYDNFIWDDRIGLTSADYTAVVFTPPAATCPTGARCDAVTYFNPKIPFPGIFTRTNQPDYHRSFNGLELTIRKRSSNGWFLNGSYAYNSAVEYYDSTASYEDPTNINQRHGYQFAPTGRIGGGGGNFLGGVPTSAKWM